MAISSDGGTVVAGADGALIGSNGGQGAAYVFAGPPSNANLSSLTLSSGSLSPVFSTGTTSYTTSVTSGTSSITVTPTAADSGATVQVRVNGGSWSSVTSGSASGVLALNEGDNPIDVNVAAQDSRARTYTVTVTRAALIATTVDVTSSLNPSAYGQSVTFTATVSPDGLSGTVDFKYNGSPIAGCTGVTLSSNQATCTKGALAVGRNLSVTADYSGNASYSGSTGDLSGGQTVRKGSSTVTVTGTTGFSYSGSPQGPDTADVTGSTGSVTYRYSGSGGTTYGPSATKPTGAGAYTVTATVAADHNYVGADSPATSFTISKATQATLTVTPLTVAYGTIGALAATGGSGSGLLSFDAGSSTDCTVIGATLYVKGVGTSCTVTATRAGDGNYNAATSAPQTITLIKGTATVTLGNLTRTATGGALTPTVTTVPYGLAVVWTGAPQSEAGSYPVAATVNDPNYQGSAGGTFVISPAAKAAQTITVTQHVPAAGAPGSSFTVSAQAGSGLPVTIGTGDFQLYATWLGNAPDNNPAPSGVDFFQLAANGGNGETMPLSQLNAVPEPSTYALLALGFGALVYLRTRQRQA